MMKITRQGNNAGEEGDAGLKTYVFGWSMLPLLVLIPALGATFLLPSTSGYTANNDLNVAGVELQEEKFVVRHIDTPDIVRGIYMTSHVAGALDREGNFNWRERMANMIDETELNTLILDIKDYSGTISFPVEHPLLKEVGADSNRIPDVREFIDYLHDKGIYVVGRLTVFQDPFMVSKHPELAVKRLDNGEVWTDYKGIAWLDPAAKEVWRYVATLAEESYNLGFDEINFDYVRFPSDGDMQNISYTFFDETKPKHAQIKRFFNYLDQRLHRSDIPISADLFGMTTTALPGYDLNIGQVFEDALEHFDYVAPMSYPSHYPSGFYGIANPNKAVYEVMKIAMDGAVEKAVAASTTPSKVRPWIQDFDYGGDYGEVEVRAQKQAVYDAGLDSWMVWDPAVRYTRSAYDSQL